MPVERRSHDTLGRATFVRLAAMALGIAAALGLAVVAVDGAAPMPGEALPTDVPTVLAPAPVTKPIDLDDPDLVYVALGDSYTSGAGILPQQSAAGACSRAEGNYPALLARALGTTVVDASCAGATSGNVLGAQSTATGTVPPQIDAVPADADLVTLSLGGNDFGIYGQMMRACEVDAPRAGFLCQTAFGVHGLRLVSAADQVEYPLAEAVAAVRRRAPQAHVVVVGYPRVMPQDGRTCPGLDWDPNDVLWADRVFQHLDDAMQAAARDAGASFVEVRSVSDPLGVCAAAPWVKGAADTVGNAAAFHPLPAGMAGTLSVLRSALVDQRI